MNCKRITWVIIASIAFCVNAFFLFVGCNTLGAKVRAEEVKLLKMQNDLVQKDVQNKTNVVRYLQHPEVETIVKTVK